MTLFEDFLKEVKKKHPEFKLDSLRTAYEVAEKAHGDQTRKSGEPYIHHPIEVCRSLLRVNLDLPSLVAGMLHDTVEDTALTLEDIEKDFGQEVRFLVDGVTKLSKLSFSSKHTAQAENFRKMIFAMSKDIRVILIKLCDRLHNMRTLQFMKPEKQFEIAEETSEIYAPLAHRLGIFWMKTELEDLSLRYTKPEVYFKLVQLVSQSKKSREKYIEDVIQILESRLKENDVQKFNITGRSKNLFSVYKKMERSQLAFDQIHDIIAFRVVCDDIRACYHILGLIHAMWKPVPGRFKDYVAMPKANLYQSLHTTVIGPMGQRIEIQIRTSEMHEIAETGIAAHWSYKDDGSVQQEDLMKFSWMRKLVEDQEDMKDPSEFLNSLKLDLFEEEVFVFTPQGEVIALPVGATPVDFAYAIHSKVGDHCVGAKINGRIVPLRKRLKSGDSLEIITSEGQSPKKDWLDFVVTSKARSKIRAVVKKVQQEQSKEVGLKLIERDFRKLGMSYQKLSKDKKFHAFLPTLSVANEDDFLIRIGYGKLDPMHAAKVVAEEFGYVVSQEDKPEEDKTSVLGRIFKKAKKKSTGSPVIVHGIDNIFVRFAKCCHPLPGEPIVGFISRGRGISVHSANCEKALSFDPERKMEIEWDASSVKDFTVGVRITTVDKPGVLAQVTRTVTNLGGNIGNAHVQTTTDRKATIDLEVSLRDIAHLHNLLIQIEKIDGIISAVRTNFI